MRNALRKFLAVPDAEKLKHQVDKLSREVHPKNDRDYDFVGLGLGLPLFGRDPLHERVEYLEENLSETRKGYYKSLPEEMEDLRNYLNVEYVQRNGHKPTLEKKTQKKGKK